MPDQLKRTKSTRINVTAMLHVHFLAAVFLSQPVLGSWWERRPLDTGRYRVDVPGETLTARLVDGSATIRLPVLATPSRVIIEAESENFEPMIELIDSFGRPIIANELLPNDPNYDELITQSIPDGNDQVVRIKSRNLSGSKGNKVGEFRLKVTTIRNQTIDLTHMPAKAEGYLLSEEKYVDFLLKGLSSRSRYKVRVVSKRPETFMILVKTIYGGATLMAFSSSLRPNHVIATGVFEVESFGAYRLTIVKLSDGDLEFSIKIEEITDLEFSVPIELQGGQASATRDALRTIGFEQIELVATDEIPPPDSDTWLASRGVNVAILDAIEALLRTRLPMPPGRIERRILQGDAAEPRIVIQMQKPTSVMRPRIPQRCGFSWSLESGRNLDDIGDMKLGSEVMIVKSSIIDADNSIGPWQKKIYIGSRASIRGFKGTDESGCVVVNVDVDTPRYHDWRAEDLLLLDGIVTEDLPVRVFEALTPPVNATAVEKTIEIEPNSSTHFRVNIPDGLDQVKIVVDSQKQGQIRNLRVNADVPFWGIGDWSAFSSRPTLNIGAESIPALPPPPPPPPPPPTATTADVVHRRSKRHGHRCNWNTTYRFLIRHR
ncbi:hypothetical protein U5801_21530 [Lamprobacter modestohalophilus]|uniref:hypothetical protein n=1 Tax=Lamprobacter modestohalophilus TaxID=1064514 RepID=UPI002ADEE4CD|nr:hypothetical protein [Lamprobacter modestohalophilus]MEA1052367.1 hypothetical protein [Lamprobacter modestohalophilus]